LIRDDRILCTACRELAPSGRCRAAARRERIDVAEDYAPAEVDLPRRCVFYAPLDQADDLRSGRERFPTLAAEYDAWCAERTRVRRDTAQRGVERAKAALRADTG